MNRIEKDSLGEVSIEKNVLYGIHTKRALDNFQVGSATVSAHLIKAFIQVKKAAAMAHKMIKSYDVLKADYIIAACDDLIDNYDSKHYPIKAIQGGAGTSTNMNVNEVIANRANQLAGKMPGDYDFIDPLIHVNKSQSTNDVYPTALRIATILLLRKTSEAFARLQESLQAQEQAYA
ncbi:MAG: lyase family protein, partial [Vallitaleaceae bacterium]|nr:lyase family protein [Vallitaleaceae bacterium]